MTERLKSVWVACSLLRTRWPTIQDLPVGEDYHVIVKNDSLMVFKGQTPVGSMHRTDSEPRIFEGHTLEEFTKVVLDLEYDTHEGHR
ncbi:hypothetical protein AVT69_gp201 [Pseudomonas phage PhiPA3]|uniref:Uncharacterized protein 203 n=1 Tax=Pseudomonas phage PhiPA3 TaxID=998086 RepID=F8SJ46_BPPA3|nr:hypothetical protein AVT69_gp201 [Pseudomonas phage PhiPA3]AEH03626.1 hypothetical protein [Pseudomonas phage PhiPA3]